MADYQISTTLKADVDKFKRAFKRAIGDTEQFKAVAKSIKDVKLKADASGVTKGVESAKKALDGFDSLDADAKLDVDATHLKTHIAIAKDLVNSFDDIDVDAELSADISEAIKNINALESYVERIDNQNADVEITADVTKANARIRELQTNLRAINGRHYSANLDADATKARKSILMAKRALNDYSRQRAKAKLEVENKAAISKIVMFKAMLRSIPNIVRTRLVVDNKKAVGGLKALHQGLENANNVLDTVANDIRTFGTVFSNMIRGVMLSNISLLVPAIASIVPALFAVLNAAGVVAGGAIGMAGAFGVATAGVFAFGAMAVSALKMVQDGTLEATREVQNYQKALSGLKSTWEGIIKQNQAQIFNTLANGINTAKVALKGLTPFINGVSKGMEQASAKMLDWAKNSQVAQKFFQMMGTTGVRIFNNMLNAAGQFGSGIISILTQLAPLAEWVSKGFEKMGASFNKWAQSTAGQNAIKSFIEYTKQNLPLIGQIFGNTFKGIFNLMKAFAPNTHLILQSLAQMSAKFAEWSATIAESDGFKKFIQYVQENGPKLITLMGNIIRIIIAVGTAMAPLASAVLDVAVAITGFIARLTEAHPAIGAILGVLATLAGIFMTIGPPILSAIGFISKFAMALTGAESAIAAFSAIGGALMTALEGLAAAFSLLLSPIGLIVAAVAAVIAIFVALWNSSEVLRDTVTGAWNAIKNAVGAAVKAVISFFQDLMGQFGYVKGGVDSLAQVWAGFVKTVEFYIKLLTPIFSSTFKGIVVIVKVVWEVIKAVITVAMHVIVGTITALLQLLTGDWEGAWKTLSQAGEAIWNAIVEMAKNIFNILKDTLVQIWQRIVSFFSEVFGPLTAIASQIWQGIVNVIVTVVQALGTFLSAIWQGIVTVATTIWTTLVTIATTLWNLLVTTITTIVTTLGTILSTIWTTIVTVATTIWTTLVTIASTIWNMLVTVITTVVQSIVTFVTTAWTTLVTITSTIMSAISSVISTIWQTIVTIVSTVVSTIVSFVSTGWSTLMSVTSSIMSSISSFISSIWSTIVSFISNSVSRAVSFVTSGFSNMLSAIGSAMSGIVSSVMSGMSRVVSSVTSGVARAVSAARDFIGDMVQVGADLIKGMINGIKNMAGELVSAAKGVVMGAVNAAKSALHIGSPSKLFRQYGIWTMEGLMIGINREGKDVISGMGSMATDITKAFDSQLAIPNIQASLKNANASMNSQITHKHQIETSPTQRLVKVEFDVDNDALTAIVNGKNAKRSQTFYM